MPFDPPFPTSRLCFACGVRRGLGRLFAWAHGFLGRQALNFLHFRHVGSVPSKPLSAPICLAKAAATFGPNRITA